MNLRDAAQEALEALNIVIADVKTTPTAYEAQRRAISALEAALAEPEQRCEYIRSSGTTHWCALAEAGPKIMNEQDKPDFKARITFTGHGQMYIKDGWYDKNALAVMSEYLNAHPWGVAALKEKNHA